MNGVPEGDGAVACLVTGGRVFCDRAFVDMQQAMRSIEQRNDGARLEPLVLQSDLAAAERDAARYRWLREHFRFANDSLHEIWFDSSLEPNDSGAPSDLDQEIDAQKDATGSAP